MCCNISSLAAWGLVSSLLVPLINDVCVCWYVGIFIHVPGRLTWLWTLSQSALWLRPARTNQRRRFPGRSRLGECGGGLDAGPGCWRPPRLQKALSCNLIFSLMTVMRAADWKHVASRVMKGGSVHENKDRQQKHTSPKSTGPGSVVSVWVSRAH